MLTKSLHTVRSTTKSTAVILSPSRWTRSASFTSIHIKPIAGSLGAEIENVNLRNPLDLLTTQQIRKAFLKYKVIFFRNQDLSPADFLRFSSHFGLPIKYPMIPGIDDYPEIIQVLKRETEINNFGGIWHCDTLYLEEPPMGTLLIARELPPHGGDTLFANQVAAYDALSNGLKSTLANLTCVNTSAKADASKTREDRIKDSHSERQPTEFTSRHPAVRTHPETSLKSLYLNIAHTERFEGWTVVESAALLHFLYQHQARPEFTCRFKWDVGSIAFWDNRSTLHNPINDYFGYRRSMHRITLAGDKPR